MHRKHQIASIFLLGIFITNLFLASILLVNFFYHQDVIAKELCIKKEEENNTCQGKCHLKKELKKVENKNHPEKPNLPTDKISPFILTVSYKNKFTETFCSLSKEKISLPSIKCTSGYHLKLIKPPIFIN